MPEAGAPPLPNISVRSKDSLEEVCTEWDRAPLDLIGNAAPWRTFRWRHGQKHYSGTYWSATEQAHVIYESRLELARLLFADFDTAVCRIIAQPFLFRARIDRRVRRHVPDYLLLTHSGPVVVDVKPSSQLDDPKVRFTLDWTRILVERRGWRYEVWSEPPVTELETIRFLAGFRNAARFDPELVNALKARADLKGAASVVVQPLCSKH
ncbi:TnsA-like heteromeric transposase endonuclease subunit [Mycolicibacterium hippocampi]|uniref:TnsA endonuclease N-terminal domain-containing protein n=1 Tax=Mycolicibacterium hippocampi TaxID=659824 RepID=A0A850PMH7_9MYCO|nr:TnsA-like heteromeric transposase endonuclease subunit [Mycolicibacterium hippocampi]NVN49360.1 hypothetical protein [Mycolicibacterium hippocampi]